MREIKIINLSLTDYKSTWDLQKKLFDLRVEGKISDTLLLNEHNHVYTIGKSGDDNHLLANDEELKISGAEVYHIDRGGDVTYHGPGQLVGYPILDLNNYYLDIHRYLRDIEEVIIRTLTDFGLKAHRDSNFTGVWVGNEKIAALGVKVSRWVTMHGFALNVNTDLSYFEHIIPCGIFHKGVTSIEKLLGHRVPLDEVSRFVVKHFENVFNVKCSEQKSEQINELINENIECLQ
jgi:lipoyl(octanoyl) transferase